MYDGPRERSSVVPGLRADQQAAAVGTVGHAAGHRRRSGRSPMPGSNPIGRPPNCRTCWPAATTTRTGRAQGARAGASRSTCSGWYWRRSSRSITARVSRGNRYDLRARALLTGEDQHAPAPSSPATCREAGTGAAGKNQATTIGSWSSTRDWRARWYLDGCPRTVHNAQAMDAWWRSWQKDEKGRAGVVARRPAGGRPDRRRAFPAYRAGRCAVNGAVPLRAGAVDDGMTVAVPLPAQARWTPLRLSWLAPGFVEDKATP